MKERETMMLRQLAVLGLISVGSLIAQAATVYTTVDGTVVRDKPMAIGSTIVATLKPATMVETIKQVGAYTSVSVIVDGKVKTGFISTKQLEAGASDISKVGVGEVKQIALGQADANSLVLQATDDHLQDPQGLANGKINDMKSANLPPGSEDPAALLTSKLDSMQVPAADLASFAKNGQLVARKSKSSAKAAQ